MSSMRLEQGPSPKKNAKKQAAQEVPLPPDSDYPSTRYFQVHFQYLYETLESLKEQVQEANRQIAAQNQALRNLSRAQPSDSDLPRQTARTAHEPVRPHAANSAECE